MDYFLFNKTSDYERGFLEHLVCDGGRLRLEEDASSAHGIFISRILDSLEPQTRWQRFTAELSLPPNTAAELRIYGTDRKEDKAYVSEITGSAEYSGEEKLKRMECFLKFKLMNRDEALLGRVTGRYLWFSYRLWGNKTESPAVSKIQLFFPWESLVSLLPELYETEAGGFLERYLAVFLTMYQEAEREIRHFPALLDLEAADPEALLWLAGWLSVDNLHSWPADRLRRYLREGAAVFGRRGTKRGMKELVYLYTGVEPYIIEPKERPFEFWILISQEAVPTYQEYQALLRVVNEGKPAHMEARLVVLKPGISLDCGSYLGINSTVLHYPPAVLGQMSQADYVIIANETMGAEL